MTNIVMKTDGKRLISIFDARWEEDCVELKIDRNGFQPTILSLDNEMLLWLQEAINEYLLKTK